jgi:hypothetical protein
VGRRADATECTVMAFTRRRRSRRAEKSRKFFGNPARRSQRFHAKARHDRRKSPAVEVMPALPQQAVSGPDAGPASADGRHARPADSRGISAGGLLTIVLDTRKFRL